MAHRPPPLYTSWYHQNRMFVAPHSPTEAATGALHSRSTLDRPLQMPRAPPARGGSTIAGECDDRTGADRIPFAGLLRPSNGQEVAIEAPLVVALMGQFDGPGAGRREARARDADAKPCLLCLLVDADTRNTQISSSSRHGFCATFPQTMASCRDHERAGRIARRASRILKPLSSKRSARFRNCGAGLSEGATRSPRYAERRGVRDFTAAKPGRLGAVKAMPRISTSASAQASAMPCSRRSAAPMIAVQHL